VFGSYILILTVQCLAEEDHGGPMASPLDPKLVKTSSLTFMTIRAKKRPLSHSVIRHTCWWKMLRQSSRSSSIWSTCSLRSPEGRERSDYVKQYTWKAVWHQMHCLWLPRLVSQTQKSDMDVRHLDVGSECQHWQGASWSFVTLDTRRHTFLVFTHWAQQYGTHEKDYANKHTHSMSARHRF
jgi:hypothetical protein